jgi:ubiquitin C
MQICIEGYKPGNTITMFAKTSDTIDDIQAKLAVMGFGSQRIAQRLDGHRTLGELNIQAESKLHLVFAEPRVSQRLSEDQLQEWRRVYHEPIDLEVIVDLEGGGKFHINIQPDAFVYTLKLKIQEKESIPPEQQRLFIGQRPLVVTRTLAFYSIVNRTEIRCTRVDGKGQVEGLFGGEL